MDLVGVVLKPHIYHLALSLVLPNVSPTVKECESFTNKHYQEDDSFLEWQLVITLVYIYLNDMWIANS